MRYKFFSVPALYSAEQEAELNRFLVGPPWTPDSGGDRVALGPVKEARDGLSGAARGTTTPAMCGRPTGTGTRRTTGTTTWASAWPERRRGSDGPHLTRPRSGPGDRSLGKTDRGVGVSVGRPEAERTLTGAALSLVGKLR